jgi:hypothetical protein
VADDLYALPLSEFAAARNKLARDLARASDKEEAARVKALVKPTQPAWIVNQLVRRRRKASQKLLRVGERLLKAQEKALGGGGRGALEKAVAAEREAVEELVAEARKISDEGGAKVSDANLARVQSTLHAVSLDEDVRAAFEAGELVTDHEATGIDALALMAAPAQKKRGGVRAKKDGGAMRRRVRDAEAEVRRIEDELEAAKRDLKAAKERVKQLDGRLGMAQRAIARARGA